MKVALAISAALIGGCVGEPDEWTSYRLALGTIEEMETVRPVVADCDIEMSRIDPLDETLALFVVYNASDPEISCARDWVRQNAPSLEATDGRWQEFGILPPAEEELEGGA